MPPPLTLPQLQNKFRGILVGLACGDALGTPLEFQPPRLPENYLREMVGGGWLQLAPGEWSGDTELMLCVAESLIARHVFDPDDIADRYLKWMNSGAKDISIQTKNALLRFEKTAPLIPLQEETSSNENSSQSNGVLPQSFPLSMFFFQDPDFVATLSPLLTGILTNDRESQQACVYLNLATAYLLQGTPLTDAFDRAYTRNNIASPMLLARIQRAMEPANVTQPTSSTLDTLEVALWAVLHTLSFEDAVVAAVNRGADADTVGAVTGAIAGAWYGLEAIPKRWRDVVHSNNRLLKYADDLLAISINA